MSINEDDRESWDWFGLSHASWLVLPRVALQSMPSAWQVKFFALVRELEETIEYPEGYTGEFAVTMMRKNKFVRNCLPPYRHHTLRMRMRESGTPQLEEPLSS